MKIIVSMQQSLYIASSGSFENKLPSSIIIAGLRINIIGPIFVNFRNTICLVNAIELKMVQIQFQCRQV